MQSLTRTKKPTHIDETLVEGQERMESFVVVSSTILTAVASRLLIAAKGGVNLVEALNKVGGPKAASEFLGWGNKTTILKTASDFTKGQLIKAGYIKRVLT